MLRQLNRSAGGRRILGTPFVGIEAAIIEAQTASGDNGPGLLYDDAIDPANANKRLRLELTSLPSAGTLFVAENGTVEFSGAPAGTYTAGYNVKADNLFVKADIATFAVGNVDATAPATTVTGNSTINAGTATGGGSVDATAPATTVNGTSSINASQAIGQQNATAPATTVIGASTINASTATGQQNSTAPATTVTGPGSINAGIATGGNGNLDATAPATTVTGSGSINAGVATGDAPQQIPAIPIVVARAVACLNLRSGIKPTMQTITGNTARIEITVADLNDTPIDPDQITIKIIEPSQPETTATPVKDAAGHYHHDVLLTRPGKWYWRVETGGQPAAASEGQINVLQSRFG